ncbi:6-bladed beta-propeller [Belliella sp. R4-6]|uniref:6-bladed beta-propeller n=1 Tax=Belliella alkalica TaxID=1730871 RepID=A0ABS9VET0_9BACT|nr:6-bladed beta-propeller [Belliella alkalica]MCH7414913.1 6-bladed beta-propeller [Belliella alkalica]
MKLRLIIVIVVLSVSCEKPYLNLDGTQIIQIDKSLNSKIQLDEIELIRLEDNPFSQIVILEEVIHSEQGFFINDKTATNTIFLYDESGKYQHHINRKGEGPGEYRGIKGIVWNEDLKELTLIPMDLNKELKFDIHGNYLNERKTNQNIIFSDFVDFGDDRLVFNISRMNHEDNVMLLKGEDIENKWLPYSDELDNTPVLTNKAMCRIDEKVLFAINARDSIYQYDNETQNVSAKYFIDFGSKKVDLSLEQKLSDHEFFKYITNEDVYFGIDFLYQADDFLSFTTMSSGGFVVFFYNTAKGILHSSEKLLNDKLENGKLDRIVGVSRDGRFIGLLDTKDIKNIKEIQSIKKNFDSFRNIDREDKVLVLFSLK